MAQELPHDVDVTRQRPRTDLAGARPVGTAPDERDLLAAAFVLPSYAATALSAIRRSADKAAAVERFALSDYLVGLAGLKGGPPPATRSLPRSPRSPGVPEEIVRRYRGRIPRHVFAREIRRGKGEVVSLYDGTITRPARPEDGETAVADPVLQPAAAAYGAAFNAYVADALGLPHRPALPRARRSDVSQQWNWQGERQEGGLGLAMSSLEDGPARAPRHQGADRQRPL